MPADTDVVILPGIGGGRRMGQAFARSAEKVREAFEAEGLRVAYAGGEDPDHVMIFMSLDWWGPVIYIGTTVGLGVVTNAIYDAIKSRISAAVEHRGEDIHPHLDVVRSREQTPGGVRITETIHIVTDDADTFLRSLRSVLGLPPDDDDVG